MRRSRRARRSYVAPDASTCSERPAQLSARWWPALAGGAPRPAPSNDKDHHTENDAWWRTARVTATLHIAGASAWYLYGGESSKLAQGEGAAADVSAPAGSHLVVFGPAGSAPAGTLLRRGAPA